MLFRALWYNSPRNRILIKIRSSRSYRTHILDPSKTPVAATVQSSFVWIPDYTPSNYGNLMKRFLSVHASMLQAFGSSALGVRHVREVLVPRFTLNPQPYLEDHGT